MSFSATAFKSSLSKAGGGARPALYKIDIMSSNFIVPSLTGTESILVKAAALPASNIAPLTVNYSGRAYKWQGFRTYDIWNVTVINDESFSIRNKIMQWMRTISGGMDGRRNSGLGDSSNNDKTGGYRDGEAKVSQVGAGGTAVQSYKLYNLWPTELGEIALDWSSDIMEEYTIGFAYDYWSSGTNDTVKDKVTPNPHP